MQVEAANGLSRERPILVADWVTKQIEELTDVYRFYFGSWGWGGR